MRRHPVSVVVVAFDSGPRLRDAVDSALRAGAHDVCIIDNASQDGAAVEVAASHPNVERVAMPRNVGFAAGCNAGLARATQPFVLLLNDDAVLTPQYFDVLVPALSACAKAAGAIGKLLEHEEPAPRIDSAGIRLDRWSLCARDIGAGTIDAGQYDAPMRVFGITGAAALYRTDVLCSVGGFDAALFAYYEDVDLAWRLGALGYVHLYEPSAIAFHSRRGHANKARATVVRAHLNRYTVWAKNEQWRPFAWRAPIALPREGLRLLRFFARDASLCKDVCRQIPQALQRGFSRRPARTGNAPAAPL